MFDTQKYDLNKQRYKYLLIFLCLCLFLSQFGCVTKALRIINLIASLLPQISNRTQNQTMEKKPRITAVESTTLHPSMAHREFIA